MGTEFIILQAVQAGATLSMANNGEYEITFPNNTVFADHNLDDLARTLVQAAIALIVA